MAIWDGGLAIYGTVIAVFLMAFLYCRRKHIKLGAMTDLCVMGLMLGQAIGRWGNFMNAELAKELKYLSRIANGYRFGNEVMGMPLRNFKCLLNTAACKLEEKK